MNREQVFNYCAGPSTMPDSVLKKAQAEILNFNGTGVSIMEINHRGKDFTAVLEETKYRLKRIMNIPDTHDILFLQGGASLQFAAIPMNLLEDGEADYAITGNFSKRAANEAKKYGKINIACDTTESNHIYIPAQNELKLTDGAKYFYYCANNTVFGTEWQYTPKVSVPLVSDMSSDILTRKVDVSKYGIIYAGAQKNMSAAGVTVVIIDKRLAGREMPITPMVMSYKQMLETNSVLNTPPCWCIYMLDLMLEWLESEGGIDAMEERKKIKAGKVYDFIDNSTFYKAKALPGSRSYMNITFTTGSEERDVEFATEAASKGLICLKGHKVAGGLRASLYNAMPMEGADVLINFMKEFERAHV